MKNFKKLKAYLVCMSVLTVSFILSGCGGEAGGGSWNKPILQLPVITAYSLTGVAGTLFAGTVNEPAKTITVVDVPVGTDVTALTATFTTTATSTLVGTTPQVSGTTQNNFTTPVLYTLTAEDHSTATYTVTVVPSSAKVITSFAYVGFPASPGTIDESAKTISVTVPFDTDLATLTTSAETVTSTAKKVQKSGAALNKAVIAADGLSSTDTVTITAADGSKVTYTIFVTKAQSSAKAITAYSFVGFTGFAGTINEPAKSIAINLPGGTDVRALTAKFATAGKVVKVGSTQQRSGTTANDFTTPVAYTVTAVNGTTVTYTVTVTVAPGSAKAITVYSFAGFTGAAGIINETAKSIAVTVPNGTNVTALAATFTTTGTGAKVGAAVQTSSATTNNFTTPVTYRITAANGSTADYLVTVTVTPALSSIKSISAFSFVGFSASPGTVNEATKSITVTLPSGTDVTSLTAAFTTTGSVVKVGAAVQTSGASLNNFTTPVTYRVTAANGSTADYLVTVTVTATVTVTVLSPNPTPPILGEAGRFVILASQRITTTAGSAVRNGDLGIEDQARSYYAGFTTGASAGQFTELVNGLSYGIDDANPAPYAYPLHYSTPVVGAPWTTTGAMITQVRTDLGNAATFLAADPNPGAPTQVCPIQLGGLTLTRGVYKTGSNVQITTGPLHLDAQGDPNSVFIFSIDGTLTTGAPGGNIILDGGAQAKNVFFRTGDKTTIGPGTIFFGSVFSWSQINVLAGAEITGSLFAVTDQVTLISDAVTKAP